MQELLKRLQHQGGSTPVKVYLWEKRPLDFPGCQSFLGNGCRIVFGEWETVAPLLRAYEKDILYLHTECDRRGALLPMLPLQTQKARVEPGARIRDGALLEEKAVVLMGAVINTGARVGSGSMIDMNAVLGAGAQVGKNCHIAAGAVLAGMLEPGSPKPVVVEDGAFIGANAVVLAGCRVGKNAVVAAGSVVTGDIPADMVAAGCPARPIKKKDERTAQRTALTKELR